MNVSFPFGEISTEELTIRLNEAFKRVGVRKLARVKDDLRRTITSTTYISYKQFEKSVNTSGGILEVIVNLRMFTPSPEKSFARLLIDEKEEDVAISLGQDSTNPTLIFKDVVNAGTHRIKVELKVSGGSLNINDDGVTGRAISSLSITEYLGA